MNDGVVQASYEPGDAAHRLGVSASGLRRLAAAYEEVHGDLPRKIGTRARLYPETALTEIAQARALVEAGRYASNVEALDALRRGLEPDAPGELSKGADQATPQAFALFVEEQRTALSRIEAALERLEASQHAQLVEPETAPQAARLDKSEETARKTVETSEHGPVVRFALWLERVLRR